MWLSIVIPVHNASEYLARCLESILASQRKLAEQTKKPKVEVLLIDNNSEDGSEALAEGYVEKYPELFKFCTQKTPGAAATRNFGVKKAKGEYLWFVDADDYIAEEALSELWSVTEGGGAQEKPDLVSFAAAELDREGKEVRRLSAIDPKTPDYKSRFVRYGFGPWQVVIHRKLWEEHELAFPEGIIHEDMALMSALILYAERLEGVPRALYYYCDNPESVLHKSAYNPHIFDIFPALSALALRFEKEGAEEEYALELEWFFIWNLLLDSARDFRAFPEGRRGIKQTREFMKFYYPNWRKNQFLRQKPLKLRLKVRLNYWGL